MATLKGTWRFNDVLTDPYGSSTGHDEYFYVNFTSPAHNYQFTAFRFIRANYADRLSYYVSSPVGSFGGFRYDTNTWVNEGDEIITFTEEQEVSDEFYEWFTANATQQASEEETPSGKGKAFVKLNIGDTVASSGTRVFKKLSTEESATVLAAGLYDYYDNLLASWDTLVNTYGMDIEKNYTFDNYAKAATSPYFVLTNNSELSAGRKLIIPDGVTTIGDYAFHYCSYLTSITIPNSVTSIGEEAFSYCLSLNSITIPNSVTSINRVAFAHCISFTSITIPNSLTTISEWAFYDCTNLNSITIPDSVTSIGERAFRACTSLTDVYYKGTEEQWAVIRIAYSNEYLQNATIHYNYEG